MDNPSKALIVTCITAAALFVFWKKGKTKTVAPTEVSQTSTLLPSQETSLDADSKKTTLDLNQTKVKLDLTRLAELPAFKKANGKFSRKALREGKLDLNTVLLPRGLPISYQIAPDCKMQSQDILMEGTLTAKAKANLEARAPVFMQSQLNAPTDIQKFVDKINQDPCIIAAAAIPNLRFGGPRNLKNLGNDLNAADKAIRDALAQGRTPTLNVIANGGELRQKTPWLWRANEEQPSPKKLSYTFLDLSGKALIMSRAQPIPPARARSVNAADISNAIVFAASKKATVINVMVSGYKAEDFEAAIKYANEQGSIVVGGMLVPPLPLNLPD